MIRMIFVLAWVGGVLPAQAGPPLGCLENATGARWCEVQEHVTRPSVVRLAPGWVHPATVRRAPRSFDAPEAVVQALPVDQLVRRSSAFGEGAPIVSRVPRDAGIGISEVRTAK